MYPKERDSRDCMGGFRAVLIGSSVVESPFGRWLSDNVQALRRGAPRRSRSLHAMFAGHFAQDGLPSPGGKAAQPPTPKSEC
jgi:hypothetical protein